MISWNIINRFTLVTSAILVFPYHAYSQDTSTGNMTVKQSEYNDALLSDGLKIELAKLEIKVEATGRRYKILSVAGKIKEKEARAVYDEYVTLQIELETLNEKLATTLIEEEKNRLDAEKAKVKADMKAKAEQDRRDAIRKAEQDREYAIQESESQKARSLVDKKRIEWFYRNRELEEAGYQKIAGVRLGANISEYENAKKTAIDKTYMISYWTPENYSYQITQVDDVIIRNIENVARKRELIVDDLNGEIIGVALVGPANFASSTLKNLKESYPYEIVKKREAPQGVYGILSGYDTVDPNSYTTRSPHHSNIVLRFQWDGTSAFMITLYDPKRYAKSQMTRPKP